MKIYLVGGAVRDSLLGLKVKERDWVIVGSTVEEMVQLGFKPVGKNFPVFIHPKTKEEYALARREKKSGVGYHGFVFYTDKEVTLEEDLLRRDLTINAIAMDEKGNIIDPFKGQNDLKNKILRHVSVAFREDPVRILRLARLIAKLNFSVACETLILVNDMVLNGELGFLVKERVWKEFSRGLCEQYPFEMFIFLHKIGFLKVVFPELDFIFSNSYQEIKNIMTTKEYQSTDLAQRLAILISFFSNENELTLFLKKLTLPKQLAQYLTVFFRIYQDKSKDCYKITSHSILRLFEQADAFRKPERFYSFLSVLKLLAVNYPKAQCNISVDLYEILLHLQKINFNDLKELIGTEKMADWVKKKRLMIIDVFL